MGSSIGEIALIHTSVTLAPVRHWSIDGGTAAVTTLAWGPAPRLTGAPEDEWAGLFPDLPLLRSLSFVPTLSLFVPHTTTAAGTTSGAVFLLGPFTAPLYDGTSAVALRLGDTVVSPSTTPNASSPLPTGSGAVTRTPAVAALALCGTVAGTMTDDLTASIDGNVGSSASSHGRGEGSAGRSDGEGEGSGVGGGSGGLLCVVAGSASGHVRQWLLRGTTVCETRSAETRVCACDMD